MPLFFHLDRYHLSFLCLVISLSTPLSAAPIPPPVETSLNEEVERLGFLRSKLQFQGHDQGLYQFQAGIYNFQISAEGLSMYGDVWDTAPLGPEFPAWRKQMTQQTIAALDPAHLISYLPDDDPIRHHLHIFTDVTCPYSRQLHTELPLLLDAGIAVHYLAFPRSGDNGLGANKMQAIWCHQNPKDAFELTLNYERFAFKLCDSPVPTQFQLGLDLGLIGTPGLIFANGRISTGYNSAIDIIAYLEEGEPLPEAHFSEVFETPPLEDKRPEMPPSQIVIDALAQALDQALLTQANIDEIDILPDYSGMYIALVGSYVYYISLDGKIGLQGERLNLADWQPRELSERNQLRKQTLALLDADSVLTFKASPELAQLSLFIDPENISSLRYLRQIKPLNKDGVSVNVLAYPETSTETLEQIWCARAPKQALLGAEPRRAQANCQDIIDAHYQIARSLEIGHAGSVVFADGSIALDYLDPSALIEKALLIGR